MSELGEPSRRTPPGRSRANTSTAAKVQLLMDKLDVTHWHKCVSGNPSDDIDPLLIKQFCTDEMSKAWFAATFKNPKAMELTIQDVRKSLVRFYKLSDNMQHAILRRYKVPPLPAPYGDAAYYQTLDFKVALKHHQEVARLSDTVRYRDFKMLDDLEKVEEMTADERMNDLLHRQAEAIRWKDYAILEREDQLREAKKREHTLLAELNDLKDKLANQRSVFETQAAINNSKEHSHLKSRIEEQDNTIRGFKRLLASAAATNPEIAQIQCAADKLTKTVYNAFDEFHDVAYKEGHPAFSSKVPLSPVSNDGRRPNSETYSTERLPLYTHSNPSYTTLNGRNNIDRGQDASEVAVWVNPKFKPSLDGGANNYTTRKDSLSASDYSKISEQELGTTPTIQSLSTSGESNQEPRMGGTRPISGEKEDLSKRIRRKFSKPSLFSRLGA